jgi:amidase
MARRIANPRLRRFIWTTSSERTPHTTQSFRCAIAANASNQRAAWCRTVTKLFETFDFLILPTAQCFPFDANLTWPRDVGGRRMDTYHRWMEVVIPATMAGYPAINVPAGFSADGLPMGLQILAPRREDLACLQLARAYEHATRWNSILPRHPFDTSEDLKDECPGS